MPMPKKPSNNCRPSRLLLLSILTLTPSCETMTSSAGCPVPVLYSDAHQDALRKSMTYLPLNDPLRGAMDDYENLRKQSQKCKDF